MTALVPMNDDDFAAWRDQSVPEFAEEKVKSGQWSKEESLAKARENFDELLPQGRETAQHHLFRVVDDAGQKVGVLWVHEQERGGERIAYVYDIVIDEAHRRRGHAQAAFRMMEQKARDLGLSGVALHVFGHNDEARALYEKLGFAPTNIHMFKRLQS